jgi:hypothetical protein
MTPKELAEREGNPIALAWIDCALEVLGTSPDGTLARAALAVNFSLPRGSDGRDAVATIRATFERARTVLVRSDRYFVSVTEAAARRFFPTGGLPPAYALFEEAVYFTPTFEPYDAATGNGFGPMCRAAMVLHESIHVIDPDSGSPEVHISEWDEPGFSAQTLEASLHNPSAYASFAAQVHQSALDWPREARFGAGRKAD